jgi:hypothetical protein
MQFIPLTAQSISSQGASPYPREFVFPNTPFNVAVLKVWYTGP